MRDFVEAGGDIALQHPLIGVGRQMMDLGDRVLGAASGAEPVAARAKVHFPDRLQHQLERGLHHAIPHGRDPQPAPLAGGAGLGDQPLPHGQGPKAAVLQAAPQLREEPLLAPHRLDVVGGLAVHSSRAGTLVAPHPTPPHQQERRVTHEVEQLHKPTVRIVGCPLVQLGLDPQYPRLRLLNRQRGPRRAGVHRRPPGIPAPTPRTCCRPSPCARLSRARTTTAAPSPPKALSRRRTCPPPAWLASGKGSPGRVPTFPTSRLTGAVPSFSPAASPHLRRRLSVWPPRRPVSASSESRCAVLTRACAAARPISARLEPVLALRGFDHWFSSAYTFPSRLPDPGHLAVPTRPVVVGAAPTLPGASRLGLPPASTTCCDRPQAESFHLRPDTWNLVAHDRLPVLAGGLHHHLGDALGLQPVRQGLQPRGEGRERPHLLVAATVPVGHAHAGHHLVFGDIQPGAARVKQLHRRHLPVSWVAPGRAYRVNDAETRAHSNSSWCREGPSVSLINGLCCTKESRARPGTSDSHPSWWPPAMWVLSAIRGSALCGPAFPQVTG